MKIVEHLSSVNWKSSILSMAGVILGAMLAAADYHVSLPVAVLLILTVLCLQIIPNVIPGIICAFATVYLSYGTLFLLDSFIMLLLGYLVYRFVSHHSSESGLYRNGLVSTLSSIAIYGVVPVFGTYYVCTHSFGSTMLFLPAAAIGVLSLAAVNGDYLLSVRDRVINTFWVSAGWIAMTVFASLRIFDPWHFLYILVLPVFVWLLVDMWRKQGEASRYDMNLSFAVLAFAALSGLGFMIYLF